MCCRRVLNLQLADTNYQLKVAVDEVFDSYDFDRSGSLDKEETFEFLKSILKMLNIDIDISEDAFELWFNQIDTDDNRKITKDEMKIFLTNLLDADLT